MRRIVLVVLALAVVTGAAGAVFLRARDTDKGTTDIASTDVRVYQPFGGGGKLNSDLQDGGLVDGSCFGPSANAGARSDAWRCNAGNSIMDPCFQDPFGELLACPDEPGGKATRLHLIEPLPFDLQGEPATTDDASPWAIQLGTGEKCRLLGGVTGVVAGERLNYGCPNADVYGDVDRRSEPWRVLVQRSGSSELKPESVSVAWF